MPVEKSARTAEFPEFHLWEIGKLANQFRAYHAPLGKLVGFGCHVPEWETPRVVLRFSTACPGWVSISANAVSNLLTKAYLVVGALVTAAVGR
jgi:hypothetical protein